MLSRRQGPQVEGARGARPLLGVLSAAFVGSGVEVEVVLRGGGGTRCSKLWRLLGGRSSWWVLSVSWGFWFGEICGLGLVEVGWVGWDWASPSSGTASSA